MRRERILLLLIAVSLQACETASGDRGQTRHEHGSNEQGSYAQSEGAACARLAPLVSNPDGSLARNELESGLKLQFAKWDKDGDGQLNKTELEPVNDYLRTLNAEASPVMDWNGDGRVSFDEFASGWRTMFDLCDRGDSGVVTKADMARTPITAPPPKQAEHKLPDGASTGGTP